MSNASGTMSKSKEWSLAGLGQEHYKMNLRVIDKMSNTKWVTKKFTHSTLSQYFEVEPEIDFDLELEIGLILLS